MTKMNDNHIEIKERRASLVAKGIIFLFLAVFSLTIALLPYIVDEFKDNSLAFYLAGGIAFCFFATMFIFLLFKECKPDNILILNSRGFTDNKNIGSNIEIEWTNVATVKLMGKKETPFLGITLENADLVMVHMKKPYAEEMRENIEEGLPHILLSQKEIRYPINELKDLFVKFTREARALKNDVPTKPKNNPFTREDVLRAFGQLDPIEDNKEVASQEAQEAPENIETVYKSTNSYYTDNTDDDENFEEEQSVNEKENDEANEIKSVDSFYEMILKQAESVKAEPNQPEQNIVTKEDSKPEDSDNLAEDTDNSDNAKEINDDVLSEDIIELLSKAKSSKITEIEKLLNSNDVPFSSVKSEKKSEEIPTSQAMESAEFSTEAANKVENDSEDIKTEEPINETEISEEPEKDDIKDDNPFVIHFDPPEQSVIFEFGKEDSETDLIQNSEETKKADNMGDTKEFYPEIIHFDDI